MTVGEVTLPYREGADKKTARSRRGQAVSITVVLIFNAKSYCSVVGCGAEGASADAVHALHQSLVGLDAPVGQCREDEGHEGQAGSKAHVERGTVCRQGDQGAGEITGVPEHAEHHAGCAEAHLARTVAVLEDGGEHQSTRHDQTDEGQRADVKSLALVQSQVIPHGGQAHALRLHAADGQAETGQQCRHGQQEVDGLYALDHCASSSWLSCEGSRQ